MKNIDRLPQRQVDTARAIQDFEARHHRGPTAGELAIQIQRPLWATGSYLSTLIAKGIVERQDGGVPSQSRYVLKEDGMTRGVATHYGSRGELAECPYGCKCPGCIEWQKREVKRLYLESDKTLKEIGEAVGRAWRTVTEWLKDMGLKR